MIKERDYDTSLDYKIGEDRAPFLDVTYGDTPVGTYDVELARVYKWRPITKDTKVARRDDSGKIVKDDKGNVVKDTVPNLTWSNCDLVLRITSGDYAGYAIKGNLSTHPDMRNSLSNFLYSFQLVGIPVKDVVKHIGAKAVVHTKEKTHSYNDKNSGLEKTVTENVASYYDRLTDTGFTASEDDLPF